MADIWLGDVARAFAALRPRTSEERRAIAGLLGVGEIERPHAQDQMPPLRGAGSEVRQATGQDDRVDDNAGLAAQPAAPAELPLLTPVEQKPVKAIGWGVRSLPRATGGQLTAVPGRDPLLAPRSAAAILQAMLARSVEEGQLNVPAMVEALARRKSIERLPRETRRTLRFGVQVLVDLGLAMQPFGRDQARLIAQVRAIAGPQRTSIQYFADAPTRGAGPAPPRTWREYEPPDAGTRVLVLSSFGLSGPALYADRSRPEEWRSFVGELQQQGCDLVALVPVPEDRWPRWLSMLVPLVCWDRTSTVSRVSSWLGRW
jgi:hypothetical protein